MNVNFTSIDFNVKNHIFSFLTHKKDLGSASSVNKEWHSLVAEALEKIQEASRSAEPMLSESTVVRNQKVLPPQILPATPTAINSLVQSVSSLTLQNSGPAHTPAIAAAQQETPLPMIIGLINVNTRQLIPRGSPVEDQTPVALAIQNSNNQSSVRVVAHVVDLQNTRITTTGRLALDFMPSQSQVMLTFTAQIIHSPINIHFMVAGLPLVPGTPMYQTMLPVNVIPQQQASNQSTLNTPPDSGDHGKMDLIS